MRLCLVLPGFPADRSDNALPALTELVRALAPRVEVVVYTLGHPARRSIYGLHGATVYCLADGQHRGLSRLVLWAELYRRIVEEHRLHPFSMIHAIGGAEQALQAALVARLLGLPSIVSRYHDLPAIERYRFREQSEWLVKLQWRFALRFATVITAASSWRGRQVAHGRPLRVGAIPLGIDTTRFYPSRIRNGERLLVASSLTRNNDLETILNAVAMVRRRYPHISLDVAGMTYGGELLRLGKIVDELGLASVVHFLGPIPHETMPAVYRRRDLLLHAALEEEEGMSVLEALATGLPVVASSVGIAASLPASVVKRFPPGDAPSLARAIEESLIDGAHARAAATIGSRLVQSRFGSRRSAEAFLDLYRGMLPPPLGSYVTLPWLIRRRRLVRTRSVVRVVRVRSA